MSNDMLESIEISIEQAEQLIAKKEALTRLTANPDFKTLVLEGYFKEEASRLVLLKPDPSLQGDSDQKTISKSIDAIGYVRQYLNTIMQMGITAERTLYQDKQTREELLAEQAGE